MDNYLALTFGASIAMNALQARRSQILGIPMNDIAGIAAVAWFAQHGEGFRSALDLLSPQLWNSPRALMKLLIAMSTAWDVWDDTRDGLESEIA